MIPGIVFFKVVASLCCKRVCILLLRSAATDLYRSTTLKEKKEPYSYCKSSNIHSGCMAKLLGIKISVFITMLCMKIKLVDMPYIFWICIYLYMYTNLCLFLVY